MAYQAEYIVLITDRHLAVVGDPIAHWTSLDITLRFNEPGSGIFSVPGSAGIRAMLSPGNRVVVQRALRDRSDPPTVLIAGPIEKWLDERADDGENGGDGTITVNFADDLARVAAREVYPNPALTPATQTTDNWTFTGNAETGLRDLVNLNAGPGALTARRVPNLVLGTTAGVGTTITVNADRMQHLGEVARRIAQLGGGLGFRTVQVGTTIEFQVYSPPDVSSSVRFGLDWGNLKYLAYEVVAPTVTTAIVGGQGEGADAAMIERTNTTDETAWGRFEQLVSHRGSEAAQELQDEGDKVLGENAATVRVQANVADIEDMRFGAHYQLGSKVAIETAPGQQVIDVVRVVHLQAWPTAGEVVSATIGNQAARTEPFWERRLREIDERVSKTARTSL